jgi:indolepyruvate ferredoxin oxidoreductase alpha subunit
MTKTSDANERMKKAMFSGGESIARAIVDAGAKLVAAYPGQPITGIVERLVELSASNDFYVEWSNCEKVAFEEALGCSLAGRRSVMVAKHVGINHILDPLMTANLTGCGKGMVILAGDEPGAYGSQNEQDSRRLGAFAEIPILEPATPEQGYRMTRQAFRLSEAYGLPVMIRFVADYIIDSASVITEPQASEAPARFNREIRWKALPARVVEDHAALHHKLKHIAACFDHQPYRSFNALKGSGRRAVVAAGHLAAKLRGFAPLAGFAIFELGTIFPLPEKQIIDILSRTDSVYILEEVEPFIEEQIQSLAQRHALRVAILGKTSGHVPWEGDFHRGKLAHFLAKQLGQTLPEATAPPRAYPSRQPFGDDCPYTPFFKTLQRMSTEGHIPRPIVVGETGCLVRLSNPPFEMLDVKYCMGSSIGIASGLSRSGLQDKILAVTGDSAFFHTGLNGLVNAAHHQANIVVVVMDNNTAALTGFQAPTGAGTTAMGKKVRLIYPEKLAQSLNIENVHALDAHDEPAIAGALQEAFSRNGLSFLVIRGRCPYIKTKRCRVTQASQEA